MKCPSCQGENDDAADACFTCGLLFVSVVRRGAVLQARYEILRPLGRGGMGAVYEAHDRVLDETVALKVLRPDIARSEELTLRFRSEIKLARRVRHPNVCAIHEYGEDGALRFISMELVDGVDLKRILRGRGALPAAEALDVGIQASRGLAAIHAAGIVHRDLKTPNLMRDAQGVVRVMDFGIAKQSGAEQTASSTGAGLVVGTPEYMSPEQASAHKVDARSDIYSMGIVLYELFTGEVPFRGDTPVATLLKHLQDAPPLDAPFAAGIPPAVKSVMRTALSKPLAERYASATELCAELIRARDQSGLGPFTAARGAGPATLGSPETTVGEDGATITLSTPVPSPVPGAGPRGARRSRASRGSFVALAAVVLVAAGVGLGRRLSQPSVSAGEGLALASPSPDASPPVSLAPEPPPPSSTLEPEATPVPEPTPETPAPTPRASPRSHAVRGPSPRPTSVLVAATDGAPGTLQLFVSPWAHVWVDGASVGDVWTRGKEFSLTPGEHELRFESPYNKTMERPVTVVSGKRTSLRVELVHEKGSDQEKP